MKQPTNRFFNAAKQGDTLTLDMFDVIGSDLFGDGITASAVKSAMDDAKKCSSITVNVNSPGGDLYEGVGIRNLLAQSGKPVSVNVIGLCASAASLIATAGTVSMSPGSCYMLHEAQGLTMGDADTMRKYADVLETVTNSAADLYTEKTGKSKADILALMKAETWLTPDEAVEQGFADCLSTSEKVKNAIAYDLTMFKNTPASLKADTTESDATCGCDCAECEGGDCKSCSNADCTDAICNCSNNPVNKTETTVSEAPVTNNLDLHIKQLAVNKRK